MGKQITPVHYEVPAEDSAENIDRKLIYYAGQINLRWGAAAQSVAEIGKLLSEARDLLKHNKKALAEWVGKTFTFSIRSAYDYIKNYETFGCGAESALLEDSAKTVLAANIEATKTAKKMIAQGKRINYTLALEIVAKCKLKVPPPAAASDDIEDAEFSPVESDSEAAESTETESPKDEPPAPPKPPVSEKDYGTCPNCAGTKWTTDDDGTACSRCLHPHGEPVGDRDEDDGPLKTQRSKTAKTAEALLRAFDDLHLMVARPAEHAEAIACCKSLVKMAKEWQ